MQFRFCWTNPPPSEVRFLIKLRNLHFNIKILHHDLSKKNLTYLERAQQEVPLFRVLVEKLTGQKHCKLIIFLRYWLSRAALNRFPFTPCLAVFSFLIKLSAILLIIEKFCAEFPILFLEASSEKATSKVQWSLFSIVQCDRIAFWKYSVLSFKLEM